MDMPEIMTLEEVADYLRVSERTVYDWAQKGEIPCGKLGTAWRFKRADIEEWVNKRLTKDAAKFQLSELKLSNLLDSSRILILKKSTKQSVLDQLIAKLASSSLVKSEKDLRNGIYAREELMSTGIGLNLGIPHVRMQSIKDMALAVAVVQDGIDDYEALDSEPVKLVFMIVAREDQHAQHLKLLAQLSSALKDDEFRNALIHCREVAELYAMLGGR